MCAQVKEKVKTRKIVEAERIFSNKNQQSETVMMTVDDRPLRQKVMTLLQQHPDMKPMEICTVLGIDYNSRGHYVRNIKYQLQKPSSSFGTVPTSHSCVFRVGCGFGVGLFDVALPSVHGWLFSGNRNGMKVWHDGVFPVTVQWFRNGTVLLWVKGSLSLGVLKGVFVRAFFEHGLVNDLALLEKIFDESVQQERRHVVFDTGHKLPKVEIPFYRKSHGLNIKLGDGSHPTSIEIEEKEPFWLKNLEKTLQPQTNSKISDKKQTYIT